MRASLKVVCVKRANQKPFTPPLQTLTLVASFCNIKILSVTEAGHGKDTGILTRTPIHPCTYPHLSRLKIQTLPASQF